VTARVAAGAATAVAAVVVLPDLPGRAGRSPFAQVVAFRPRLLAGLVAVLVPVALVAALGRRARSRTSRSPGGGHPAPPAVTGAQRPRKASTPSAIAAA